MWTAHFLYGQPARTPQTPSSRTDTATLLQMTFHIRFIFSNVLSWFHSQRWYLYTFEHTVCMYRSRKLQCLTPPLSHFTLTLIASEMPFSSFPRPFPRMQERKCDDINCSVNSNFKKNQNQLTLLITNCLWYDCKYKNNIKYNVLTNPIKTSVWMLKMMLHFIDGS